MPPRQQQSSRRGRGGSSRQAARRRPELPGPLMTQKAVLAAFPAPGIAQPFLDAPKDPLTRYTSKVLNEKLHFQATSGDSGGVNYFRCAPQLNDIVAS